MVREHLINFWLTLDIRLLIHKYLCVVINERLTFDDNFDNMVIKLLLFFMRPGITLMFVLEFYAVSIVISWFAGVVALIF